ncbi:hypothetical protein ACFP51_34255 [Streptomyces pratens]|uniref:Small secreted protein n=1 Tax=Streptomyces pratens TaxID=887456 RepID=A0ABW1LZK5_9ACTN
MKISTACQAALVAASALAVLAPTQSFAAEAPACTAENIAYLDAQDKQEDATADAFAARQAYDRTVADQKALDDTAEVGRNLYEAAGGLVEWSMYKKLYEAAERRDPAGVADAAVAEADAAQKAIDAGIPDHAKGRNPFIEDDMKNLIAQLRSKAEEARKMTAAPNPDGLRHEVATTITAQTEADKAVRPARDAYRECLANTDS